MLGTHDILYALEGLSEYLGLSRRTNHPRHFWYQEHQPRPHLSIADVKSDMVACSLRRATPHPTLPDTKAEAEWWHVSSSARPPLAFTTLAPPPPSYAGFKPAPYRNLFSELKHVSAKLEYTRRLAIARTRLLGSLHAALEGLPPAVADAFRHACDVWQPHAEIAALQSRYEALMDGIYADFSAGGYRDKTMWRTHRAVNRGRALAAAVPEHVVRAELGSPFRAREYALVVWDLESEVATTIVCEEAITAVSIIPDGGRITWSAGGWIRTPCGCATNRRATLFAACTEGSRKYLSRTPCTSLGPPAAPEVLMSDADAEQRVVSRRPTRF